MMAQEAASKEITDTLLLQLLAFKKPFTSTDVNIGDTEISYKAESKKSAPRRRGPGLILGLGEAGVTLKFQSQTFRVARFRARRKEKEKDVEDAELDPSRERSRRICADLGSQPRQVDVGKDM